MLVLAGSGGGWSSSGGGARDEQGSTPGSLLRVSLIGGDGSMELGATSGWPDWKIEEGFWIGRDPEVGEERRRGGTDVLDFRVWV